MNSAVLNSDYPHFEQRLRARWRVLRAEIRDTLLRADQERYTDIAGQVHDAEDQSLADLLTDVSHAEVARDVQEVRDIESALQRIASGTYGRCIRCQAPIPRERLEAHPTAKRCLSCQQLHERTHTSPRTASL